MQETVELLKGEWLWKYGDPATSVAVVRRGKLAVRDDTRLIGVLYKRMVLGETALLEDASGGAQIRTVSVHALEDGTQVAMYPPAVVATAIDEGEREISGLVLKTLIGQTIRNWLLVVAANEKHKFLHKSLESFSQSLVDAVPRLDDISGWQEFSIAFRTMYALRNESQQERARLVPAYTETEGDVERAGHVMRWLFKGSDFAGEVESFLAAERERARHPSD